MKYSSRSEEDTRDIAKKFVDFVLSKKDQNKALVVSLLGELGASKTTFTKHFAREVGINDTVQSPTFVIEKIYDLKDTKLYPIFHDFIHIDAYRIEKDEEMLGLGWEKIVSNPKNIIFVEWGEKIQNILGEHTKINFYHGEDESQRYIEF